MILLLIVRVTLIATIIALAMKIIQVIVDEYEPNKNMHE
jgi:hypothetical protein